MSETRVNSHPVPHDNLSASLDRFRSEAIGDTMEHCEAYSDFPEALPLLAYQMIVQASLIAQQTGMIQVLMAEVTALKARISQ